jgi:ubiquitin-protein ligase
LQQVYHPSFDNEGAICIDILRKDEWSPMSGIREVLIALTQLFKDQSSDHPLSEEIAEVYKKNKTLFLKNAKEWTKKYAVKK